MLGDCVDAGRARVDRQTGVQGSAEGVNGEALARSCGPGSKPLVQLDLIDAFIKQDADKSARFRYLGGI